MESKLHDGEPEIGKYPETKKRINKMRRQLEKFEDENPQAKKRVNKIRRQIQKLEHELDQGESDEEEVLDDINVCFLLCFLFFFSFLLHLFVIFNFNLF